MTIDERVYGYEPAASQLKELRAEIERLNALWAAEHNTVMRLGTERDEARAEVERLERQRDGLLAAVESWQREVSGRDADIDKATALLRECLDWFNAGPDADRPDDLCSRIDAFLAGGGR